MTSLFALPCCLLLLANDAPAFGLRAHAHAEIRGATHGNQNCTETAHRCHDFGPSDARFDTQAATAALPWGAVRTTGPATVHHRLCSKWAERLESAVTTVHRSASVRVSAPPTFTIGSMAMQSPSFISSPPSGDAVHDLLVDARADHAGERREHRHPVTLEVRRRAASLQDVRGDLVELAGRHAGSYRGAARREHLRDDAPGLAHLRRLIFRLQRDHRASVSVTTSPPRLRSGVSRSPRPSPCRRPRAACRAACSGR